MGRFSLEACKLFNDMKVDDDRCTIEAFRNILAAEPIRMDLKSLDAFLESCERLGKWSMHLVVDRPSLIADCCFVGIENVIDMIIEYGIHCELHNIPLVYFDENEKPVLGGVVGGELEKRINRSLDLIVCAKKGFTVSAVTKLCEESNKITSDDKIRRRALEKLMHNASLCAATYGHLETLMYLRKYGCSWDDSTRTYAIINGHLDVLKYFCETEPRIPGKTDDIGFAAKKGHFEIVKWLHETGESWDATTMNAAAEGGNLQIVKYLLDQGCIQNFEACFAAVKERHTEAAIYLHENTCPIHCPESRRPLMCEQMFGSPARAKCTLTTRVMEAAIVTGNEKMVEYMCEQGYILNLNDSYYAAGKGSFAMLKLLIEKGCPWDIFTTYSVASRMGIDEIKYLRSLGCSLDATIMCIAINRGDLEMVKYLCDQGCPRDRSATEHANLLPRDKRSQIMEYLRSRGFVR